MRRRGGPTSKVPEPTMLVRCPLILPVLYPMQMRLSSHVLSLSLFPLLLWIVALINKDRKCLDQIRYYYGLISTKYRTVAVLGDDKLGTNCHTNGTIVNDQLLLCACILFLSFEGTHPCLRNTFILFCCSLTVCFNLPYFAYFCHILSSMENIKMSEWNMSASTLQASSQCWIGILNISSEHILELAFKSPCLWVLVWSLQILSHPNLILAVSIEQNWVSFLMKLGISW